MEYEDIKECNKLTIGDLVIVIMGPTGTGKSNIIDNLTGQLGKRTGHGLRSYTSVISAVRIKNHPKHGDRIVVVDTPGFSDTEKSDFQILQIIGEWLADLCRANVFLCGILYLHRITDIRLTGSDRHNLTMLSDLCGSTAAKNIVFVTTMWDEVQDDSEAEQREEALKAQYWNPILNLGASTAHFYNSKQSAWDIIHHVLCEPIQPVPVRLQHEMVDLKRSIEETEAAKRLQEASLLRCSGMASIPTHDPISDSASLFQSIQSSIQEEYHFIRTNDISQYINSGQATKVKTEDLSPHDFIIAVMGPTGSGKSTFIDTITGHGGTGRRAQRLTASEIHIIKLSIPGPDNIVFVDTPGFDDVDKSDADILKMIADWLAKTYRKGILLSGILYFHRISDNRMSSTALKNLRIFQALCGQDVFNNLVLVTTMWDEVGDDIGNMREGQLKESYWKSMVEHGSTTKRFKLSRQSAFQVIETLLDPTTVAEPLRVQFEMVEKSLQLNETAAGKQLCADLKEISKKHQSLLRTMAGQLKRSRAGESIRFRDEYLQLKEMTSLLACNMRQLDLPFRQRLMRAVTTAIGGQAT